MQEVVKNGNVVTPMLFPYEPEQFWQSIRQVVREEVSRCLEKQVDGNLVSETPG